jgi:hypothetical protein
LDKCSKQEGTEVPFAVQAGNAGPNCGHRALVI